jgi:hypothetical protein
MMPRRTRERVRSQRAGWWLAGWLQLVPIYSLAVPFDEVIAAHRGYPGVISEGGAFAEAEVVNQLQNTTWMRYYEWFQSSGWSSSIGMSVDNARNESAHGVPIVGHAYGKPLNCSDPNDSGIGSAVAAFLIAQDEYCYFQTSSSVVGADVSADHVHVDVMTCMPGQSVSFTTSTGLMACC